MEKKPLIGIAGHYLPEDELGSMLHIGVSRQTYDIINHDFVAGIERAGGIPLVLPYVSNPDLRKTYVDLVDGLIFTGGTDPLPSLYGEDSRKELGPTVPKRDLQELDMARYAYVQEGLPILGICRGIQVFNISRGGSLYQDIPSQFESQIIHSTESIPRFYGTHQVGVEEGSILEGIVGSRELWVNSFHHQAVKKVGEGLKVVARSRDGLVEALEGEERQNLLLVQWHPEMMAEKNETQQAILNWLVARAGERKKK